MLSLNMSLGLMLLCCAVLTVGFAMRERPWAPGLMLASTVALLGLMAANIIGMTVGG